MCARVRLFSIAVVMVTIGCLAMGTAPICAQPNNPAPGTKEFESIRKAGASVLLFDRNRVDRYSAARTGAEEKTRLIANSLHDFAGNTAVTVRTGQEKKPGLPEIEVHVVGLYQAADRQHFRVVASWGEDTDWERFCATLVEHAKKDMASPGKRIWDHMPEKARKIAADKEMVKQINKWAHDPKEPPAQDVLTSARQLWRGLEEVLRRPDFYDEKTFAGIMLDGEAKELLGRRKDLLTLESLLLHRRLLEASFPKVVKKSPFDMKKATVSVRVLPTKQPVILVLCSSESVVWEVDADKDARIEKIIVGGYYLQAVRGSWVPVTYQVYDTIPPGAFFYAYKRDDDNFRKMSAAVRSLTGKEIATFQGRYSYDKGPPFVVGAK